MEYTVEKVSQEEYDHNADKVAKKYFTGGIVYANKSVAAVVSDKSGNNGTYTTGTIQELEACEGKTFYIYHYGTPSKITYSSLALSLVDVTIMEDGSVLVSHYKNAEKAKETLRLSANVPYVIAYFEE